MTKTAKIVGGIVILGLVVWISSYRGASPKTNSEPIKIGAILSMTGNAAAFGEFAKKAIDMAVNEINGKGGVDGRKIEVVFEDDHTDAKVAVSAFQKLVSVDKVQGLIGGLWDFNAQPLLPLALSSKIAFLSPSNFRIAGSFELNDQSFVLLNDFNKTIRVLTPVLKEDSVKKLAVVHFKSPFGQEVADTLGQVMVELGKPKIVEESYAQLGGNDFKTTVAKLKAGGIDTVFLDMIDLDAIQFLQRSKEFGFKPRVIGHTLLADALENPDTDKSLFEGDLVLDWETKVNSTQFTNTFSKLYGEAPSKSADKSYNAVYILTEAIANSNATSEVAGYIASHTFKTINGSSSFTPEHAAANIPVNILVIKNGALVDYKTGN